MEPQRSPTGVRNLSPLDDSGLFRTGLARLGPYDILGRLDRGGVAGVYVARPRDQAADGHALVALRVLHERFGDRPSDVELFMRESSIAVDLSHPNVVDTHTAGHDDGQYWIAMEYLDGVPLSVVLERASGWSLHQRLPLIGALCMILGGLHYLHEFRDREGRHVGLIYRDLQPSNIFIGFDGRVKLLDFGSAKAVLALEETVRASVSGVAKYVAPEALAGVQSIDRRFDIFCAGLVLGEIVTGQPLRDLRAAGYLPQALVNICQRALAHVPAARHATAAELKQDVRNFLTDSGYRVDTRPLSNMVTHLFGDIRQRRQRAIAEHIARIHGGAAERAHSLTFDRARATHRGPSRSGHTERGVGFVVPPIPPELLEANADVADASPPVAPAKRGKRTAARGAVIGAVLLVSTSYFAWNRLIRPDLDNSSVQAGRAIRSGDVLNESQATPETGATGPAKGAPKAQSEPVAPRHVEPVGEPSDAELLARRPVLADDDPPEVEPTIEPRASRRRSKRRATRSRDGSRGTRSRSKPREPSGEPGTVSDPRPGDDLRTRRSNTATVQIDSEIPWD